MTKPQTTPPGWKLVPLEPTFAKEQGSMSYAGAKALPMVEGVFGNAGAIACEVYRAMIAAAPEYKP